MSASLQVRCTNCNQRFQPAAGTCPVCAATNKWETCVVETDTTGVDSMFVHPVGVAFFAYGLATLARVDAPAFAQPYVPAPTAWSSSTPYAMGELVTHNNIVWCSRRASTNVAPVEGADWGSTEGTLGPQGPPGADGAAGPQGPPGNDGAPGLGYSAVVKLTADEAGKTNNTLVNTGLTFAVLANTYYAFKFVGVWRSTATTVGLRLALTVPAFTVFTALARIGGFGADGAASEWQGVINTSGDVVTCTATAAINVDMPFVVEGVLLPSANGNLTLQYAAETTGATVTLRQGSVGLLLAI